LRYFIIFLLLGFLSCAVPGQDIVVRFNTVDGIRYLEIPEGSLDESWHGLSWWTPEEHRENVKARLERERKRSL